jgi:hypothetical protein
MSKSKIIIATFLAEKLTMDHMDKMYIKGVISSLIDAMKIKGIDYKMKKRLEDSYHYLTKAIILAGDKPNNSVGSSEN